MSKKDNVAAVPKYRFPEFALDASIDYVAGGVIFDPITNRNHHADLPILAITQEYGAIPRDEIDYKVSVTKKSLKAYKIVEKGDFIISLRSFQGGIEYSMYDGICSPAYIILRKKTNIIDQYYKYYFKSHRFIQDLNKDLEGIRDGKMISYGQFSSILLPKPDEEEQQKIADCLSSTDDLISVEEKKLSLLNDYKKGWVQKLFPAEGKTVPEWRFPEFILGDSIDYVEGRLMFDAMTNRNHNADLPILAITQEYGAIPRDKIDYTVFVTEKSLASYKVVEKGDFIISLRSFQGGIEYSMYDGICSPAYIILRKKINIIDQYYKYYFKSHRFIQDLNKNLEGIRDGKMVSYSQFSSILLPKPDRKEQQKIANFLSSIDDLINKQKDRIEALKQHKKALMQGLFPSIEEVYK